MIDTERENEQDLEEGDYVITPGGPLGSQTILSECGMGYLGSYDTDQDAIDQVKKYMKADGFFSTLWHLSDHGNLCVVELDWKGE